MKQQLPLLPGEIPMPSAPKVELDDGTNCIPQHYLSYQHTRESVEAIVAEISYDPYYLLFVDEDAGGIFIQVGIVGLDNYQAKHTQHKLKIVYARRWRVEPQLPSSEIIQTAFLALMKAREHEIRELVKFNYKGKCTTPFSCHHDLPLMAMSKDTDTNTDDKQLSESNLAMLVSQLSYDEGTFSLERLTHLDEQQSLVCIKYHATQNTRLPELLQQPTLHIIVPENNTDAFLYAFMDSLLHLSNRHVEEHFKFKHFARFSRKNSVVKISDLSAKTRHKSLTADNIEFQTLFQQSNYETDETRVPSLSDSLLGAKITAQIAQFDIGNGILPKNEHLSVLK